MLLSTQTTELIKKYGYEESIIKLAAAGFDAYDMSMGSKMRDDETDPFNQPDYLIFASKLRKIADEHHIVCNQAHAPFHGQFGSDKDRDEIMFNKIVRSMEIASVLGARDIVVHGQQHLIGYCDRNHIKALNMAFYQRLLPYCEKYQIRVAIENTRVCNTPEEFCDWVDTLNSPWIGACLDVGHAGLFGVSPDAMVRALGGKRLIALHVHDNDQVKDLHMIPFTHKIDFDVFTKALHDVGYTGDMTFEADSFIKFVPEALIDSALKYMHDVGRHLIAMTK